MPSRYRHKNNSALTCKHVENFLGGHPVNLIVFLFLFLFITCSIRVFPTHSIRWLDLISYLSTDLSPYFVAKLVFAQLVILTNECTYDLLTWREIVEKNTYLVRIIFTFNAIYHRLVSSQKNR